MKYSKRNTFPIFHLTYRKNRAVSLVLLCGVLFVLFISPLFSVSSMAAEVYKATAVEIPFDCSVGGDTGSTKFQFKMVPENAESPVPSEEVVTLASGQGTFHISVQEPGSYKYQIYEVQGTEKDIAYDKTVYDVTVFVSDDMKGGLMANVAVTLSGTDEKPDKLEFVNSSTRETTETTEEPKKPSGDTAKTGDDTPLVLLIVLLVISLTGIGLILWGKRRSSRDDKGRSK